MVLTRYSLARPNSESYRPVAKSRLAIVAAAVSVLFAGAVFLGLVLQERSLPISFTRHGAEPVSTPVSAQRAPSIQVAKPLPAADTGSQPQLEFTLSRSRHVQHVGPIGVEVRRIDARNGLCDVVFLTNGHRIRRRHLKINETVELRTPKSTEPSELVLSEIGKNRVSGYLSEPGKPERH